ncbi:MAG: sugar phosphate nucleotidyltransferase [Gammaproteobacteria bacterium]
MQAMILAAGLGKRLRPLTEKVPKPLLEVGGLPIIERVLLKLHEAGYRRFVINTFHLSDLIIAWSKTIKIDAEIIFSVEDHLMGTGGGIVNASHYFDEERVLICNSDILFNFDLKNCFHSKTPIQLIGIPNPAFKPTGDFSISSEGLVFLDSFNSTTFAGISLVDPTIFHDHRKRDFPFDLWKTIYLPYIMSSLVSGIEVQDFWLDIGTLDRLQEAKNRIHD